MPKKMNAVAKLLLIYDGLNETEQQIAFDLLRSKQPKRVTKKSTKKPARNAGQQSSRRQSAAEQSRSTEMPEDAAGDVTGSEDVA